MAAEADRELSRLLEEGLASHPAVPQGPVERERWARLSRLIESWGRRINLTGYHGTHEIARRLLLEAAALAQVLPTAETIADLGSGAGIPGIPIALCRPEARLVLVESRERRHHFQRAVIRELGLDNVEALRGRAEELPARPSDVVISQAFAKPERAAELMRPWLAPGGWLAIATNPDFPGLDLADLEESEIRPYAGPGGPPRAVWLGRFHH